MKRDRQNAQRVLLEEHESRVKALQDALIVGERSGEPRPFDFDQFKAGKRSDPLRQARVAR